MQIDDKLRDLERLLAVRKSPCPSPGFSDRVLGAVRDELSRRRSSPSKRLGFWNFAAAAAAVAVVWVNLSMSVVNNTEWDFRQTGNGKERRILAEEIRELVPEMSKAEAAWRAATMLASAQLAKVPDYQRVAGRFNRFRDLQELE